MLVSHTWLEPTAAVVEDAGELVVISGLRWIVGRMAGSGAAVSR
jgi:hypothetical protein